ncbi:tyrosine-type recombinase/integrase [Nonomuraea sp. PA05]|uniref:tyrosine-type recombinase/integrase n=1 Tax=Nonomuraea sp. PA05 TaxID=2604466 RepID=UPI0011DC46FF|nr:tyrosine-type recombinase/integrase [Nonomuraea sp. PA05]TYB71296.1 tyrosine-type recombinase/integrase [Nonomuraea sp. PA05]
MSRSYKVTFWKIKRNTSSKKPSYVVRWTVEGKENSRTLGGKELAENFLSDLRQAARRGEWFDTETGLPESMLKAQNSRTWLEFARAYMTSRWPHLAAKSRENIVESLVVVTMTLTLDRKGRPDTEILRRAVRKHVFLPEERQPDPDAQIVAALRWLNAASLPMNELKEARHTRAVLEALAVVQDGTKAATTSFRRRRAAFHTALEHAVELGDLDFNPLDRVKWKPAKLSNVVDRRAVVNPRQARELLTAVTYVGRTRGPMMAAMFACMYFAGLRPAEAQGLQRKGCVLPVEGWGQVTPSKTRPQSNSDFTDSGGLFDERGLKHRAENEERPVPIPPELVAILRAHIETFGAAWDGRLFYTRGGGTFTVSAYTQVWKQARELAFTPEQVDSPLAGRPYDLRHAAVSLWLNAGVHAPEVAERAGHSVDVLLKIYAKCIDGQREIANQRIEKALGEE